MQEQSLRLGVNIDHIATVRNARGGDTPDPIRAAHLVANCGAEGITAHLREDRRHITDHDISRLVSETSLPLNLEMAATEEMLQIALRYKPNAVCIVPEKREERTTEGGLEILGKRSYLEGFVRQLGDAGIRVSLFIEPDPYQVEAACSIGVPVVELHTGAYCETWKDGWEREYARIQLAAERAEELDLECHAGHGLDFDNVGPIASIPTLVELNIGHFLIGEAIFIGLERSIRKMRLVMDKARHG